MEFRLVAGGVRLVKARPGPQRKTRGRKLIAHRRGKGDFKMTTDEVIEYMRRPPAEEGAPRRK